MNCLLCRGLDIISPSRATLEDTDEGYDGRYPTIPITYNDLKSDLRYGLTAEARQYWWPILPLIQHNQDLLTPPNIHEISKKRYLWATQRMNSAHAPTTSTNNESENELSMISTLDDNHAVGNAPPLDHTNRIDEILALLIQMYDLKEPGLVKTYVSILVLMIPSVEICFNTCCATLDRPDWFISPTAVNHRLKLYTFKELVKKYLPKEFIKLERIGGLNSEFLNLLFIDLFFSLMPTPDVMRIMDSFLLEGTKIIHRYGIGLIYMNRDLLTVEGIG